jgi:hypothetical protein
MLSALGRARRMREAKASVSPQTSLGVCAAKFVNGPLVGIANEFGF